MPTVYEAALLSEYAYNPSDNPLPEGWTEKIRSSQNTLGYLGILLIKDENEEAVIAHRGTKTDLSGVSARNAMDDTTITTGGIPASLELAHKFSSQCAEELDGIACTQVGHSLGGFHAHLAGYAAQHHVMAFDPHLGLIKLEDAVGGPLEAGQVNQHHSYFIATSIINVLPDYPGHQYVNQSHLDLKEDTIGAVNKARELIDGGMEVVPAAALAAGECIGKQALRTHNLQSFIQLLEDESNTNPFPEIQSAGLNVRAGLNTTADTLPGNTTIASSTAPSAAFFSAAPAEQSSDNQLQEGFVSEMDPDNQPISKNGWVLSLVNTGSFWTGHAVMVIEGVNREGRRFVNAYDISGIRLAPDPSLLRQVNVAGIVTKIRCSPDIHEQAPAFLERCKLKPHTSKPITQGQGRKLIKAIKADSDRTEEAEKNGFGHIPYQLFGSQGSLLTMFSQGDGINCAQYLIQKCVDFGIEVSSVPKPKAVAGSVPSPSTESKRMCSIL